MRVTSLEEMAVQPRGYDVVLAVRHAERVDPVAYRRIHRRSARTTGVGEEICKLRLYFWVAHTLEVAVELLDKGIILPYCSMSALLVVKLQLCKLFFVVCYLFLKLHYNFFCIRLIQTVSNILRFTYLFLNCLFFMLQSIQFL